MHKLTLEEFIRKAREVHCDRYDYSKVIYKNNKTKICIVCSEHGEFWQTPANHLSGRGCSECGKLCENNMPKNNICFIKEANEIHKGRYIYAKTLYRNNYEKVCITCPTHGDFWQVPSSHLSGRGCPKCGIEASTESQTRSQKEFIYKCNKVHKYKYLYDKTKYVNSKSKICITCPTHGDFWQIADNHLCGHGCPLCGNIMSNKENEIYVFCKQFDCGIELRNRTILNNKEIDIYCPSKKIGIEFNGLYWHSEQFKSNPKYCHLEKTRLSEKKGIRLIHIFEDEWIEHSDIIKSLLREVLQSDDEKGIPSKEFNINKVQKQEALEFLEKNCINGKVKAKYYIGIFHNDDLVSLMALTHNRGTSSYTLLRLCNKINTNVKDGFKNLLHYFISVYKPNRIIAYTDKRFMEDTPYEKLGFVKVGDVEPNYYYINGNKRESKTKYSKKELVKQGFDNSKTEHQIMMERGMYRIYDCGQSVFELIINY